MEAVNKAREYALRRKYNLTLEQYDDILCSQDNRCRICRRHRSEFKTNLCVDHDHETGEIRGILCTFCNRVIIGRLKRSGAELLARGAEYLAGPYTGIYVNKIKKKRRRKATLERKNNNKRKRRT